MLPSQIKHDVYGGGVGKILDGDSGPHSPLIEVALLEGEVTWDYQGQETGNPSFWDHGCYVSPSYAEPTGLEHSSLLLPLPHSSRLTRRIFLGGQGPHLLA